MKSINFRIIHLAFLIIILLPLKGFTQSTVEEAQLYFQRGNEHLARATQSNNNDTKTRELNSAIEQYLISLGIVRSKNTIFNLAICYEQTGELEKAHRFYTEYLTLETNNRDRQTAQDRLAALRSNLALIRLNSIPDGALVYLDRRDLPPLGLTPIEIALTPGSHTVYIIIEGYQVGEIEVSEQRGNSRDVNVNLIPRAGRISINSNEEDSEVIFDNINNPASGLTPFRGEIAPGSHVVFVRKGERIVRRTFVMSPGGNIDLTLELPAEIGKAYVSITTNVEGGELIIDGEPIKGLPVEDVGLSPGTHTFIIEPPEGFESWEGTYTFNENQRIRIEVVLGRTEGERRFGIWPWLNVGLTVLTATVTTSLGIIALQKHGDFDSMRQTCESDNTSCYPGTPLRNDIINLADEIDNYNITTDVFLGVTIASGISSILLFLFNRAIPEESTARIVDINDEN